VENKGMVNTHEQPRAYSTRRDLIRSWSYLN